LSSIIHIEHFYFDRISYSANIAKIRDSLVIKFRNVAKPLFVKDLYKDTKFDNRDDWAFISFTDFYF